MIRNLVESIYGKSSYKDCSFCPNLLTHPKFRIILPNGYRREEFLKSANQKQESPVAAMFVNGSERNEQSL
jgi:hypothetical protein